MGAFCNGKELESPSANVHEVVGEPAIVINGVPNVPSHDAVHTHFDASGDEESKCDPFFGEWLEGRNIRKKFGDWYYCGKVVKYDAEANWYRVVYEDGDFEDLEWHELEEVLLPLDISVPLTTLALQRFEFDSPVPCSDGKIAKPKRSGEKSIVLQKTLDSQQPHPNERKGKEIIEGDLMTENARRRAIESKRGSQTERTTLNKHGCEKPIVGPEENNRALLETSRPTETKGGKLVQMDVSSDDTEQGSLKRQREIQKENGETARAEKQRRIEKSSF